MTLLTLGLALFLQDGKPAENSGVAEAILQFKAEYARAATEADRVRAVQKLGDVTHSDAVKVLVTYLSAPEVPVAIETAKALAKFTEVKGVAAAMAPYLTCGPNKKRTGVRIEIVKTIATLKDPAPLATLHSILRERDLFLAKEVVVCLQTLRQRASVPVLIDYLKVCERAPLGNLEVPVDLGRELTEEEKKFQYRNWNFTIQIDADEYARLRKQLLHEPILEALKSLTKQDWQTYKGWHEWWGNNAGTFQITD